MSTARVLEVIEKYNKLRTIRGAVDRGRARMPEPLCTYNPGSTCAGVMQAGNGVCCRDMDTSDRIRHLHARYQESLEDLPF